MEPTIDLTKQTKEIVFSKTRRKPNLVSFTIIMLIIGVFGSFVAFTYLYSYAAPSNWKNGTIITIGEGDNVESIADKLSKSNLISSKLAFKLAVVFTKAGSHLQQGEYLFENNENVYRIVNRIARGIYNIDEVSILIREGLTRKEMASIFEEKLPSFSAEQFMEETKSDEGYLFPDTYKFFKTAGASLVVSDLKRNFDFKSRNLKEKSDSLQLGWADVMKIASLLELEGKTKEDREMISDIIYRRLSLNMPLQMDASFLYFMNKASLQLTKEDLFAESPYNTYRNKGLPPTPICNPSLESISAAIYPKQNEYLYYLSDKSGIIHYAKTFDEHKNNKKLYLTE